ncbi:hypothetical protein FOZ63_033684, partial [Perkinsus olseni]
QRIAADRWLAVLIPHDDLRRLVKPSLAVRYPYSYTAISVAATTATPDRMCTECAPAAAAAAELLYHNLGLGTHRSFPQSLQQQNTPLPMATEEQPLPSPEEATVDHEAPHQLDAARIVRGLRNSAGYWRNLFSCPSDEEKRLSDDPERLIPDPEAEVMAHVATKCAQIGAGFGLLSSSLAALALRRPHLYRKALSPAWTLGGLVILTPFMWYSRMVRGGVDYEGFLDRAYRIRFNTNQVITDRCALIGAAIGGGLGPIQGLGMARGMVLGFLTGTFGAGLYNNFEAIESKVVGRPVSALRDGSCSGGPPIADGERLVDGPGLVYTSGDSQRRPAYNARPSMLGTAQSPIVYTSPPPNHHRMVPGTITHHAGVPSSAGQQRYYDPRQGLQKYSAVEPVVPAQGESKGSRHHPGAPPPGYVRVASHSRPGEYTYYCPAKDTRYATVEMA